MMGCTRSREHEGPSYPLAEQDQDAAEVNETQVIERVALVANYQPEEVAKPGDEPFDLPATFVPPQETAILGLSPCAASSMGSNHLDAQLDKRRVQRVLSSDLSPAV